MLVADEKHVCLQNGAPAQRFADAAFRWQLLGAILALTAGPSPADPASGRPWSGRAQQNDELSHQLWLDMFCLHAEALDAADEASVILILQSLR